MFIILYYYKCVPFMSLLISISLQMLAYLLCYSTSVCLCLSVSASLSHSSPPPPPHRVLGNAENSHTHLLGQSLQKYINEEAESALDIES